MTQLHAWGGSPPRWQKVYDSAVSAPVFKFTAPKMVGTRPTTGETTARGLLFKPDGTRVYYLGESADTVFQYDLGTAWDIMGTWTSAGSFRVTTATSTPQSLAFNDTGSLGFYLEQSGTSDRVVEYALSTAFDWRTAVATGKVLSVNAQDGTVECMRFRPDGLKLYILGSGNDRLYQFSLTTAFDISTATFEKNVSVAGRDTQPVAFHWFADGHRMALIGEANSASRGLMLINFDTAWDIASLNADAFMSLRFTSGVSNPDIFDLAFRPDEKRFWLLENVNALIRQFDV